MMLGLSLNIQDVVAQMQWKPDQYNGVQLENQRSVFVDRFEDDSNNWSEKTNESQIFVASQGLMLKSIVEEGISVYRPFSFNKDNNFQIETNVRLGKSTTESALVFGAKDDNNLYTFAVSTKGFCTINSIERGVLKIVEKKDLYGSFQKESNNTLTVRRIADKWYFFINKEIIYTCDAKQMFGTGAGWYVNGKGSIYSNLLSVSELSVVDKSAPLIMVMLPQMDGDGRRGGNTSNQFFAYTSYEKEVKLLFKVKDQFKIKEIKINDVPVTIGAEDKVSSTVSLFGARTDIIIEATDENDNIARTSIAVKYEEPVVVEEVPVKPVVTMPAPVVSPKTQTATTSSSTAANTQKTGRNFALFIAVNDYNDWPDLYNPIQDCQLISKVLNTQYQFSANNTIYLYNQAATRKNILRTLNEMVKNLTSQDNLLIYYAGHGFYDSTSRIGYWIPVDAEKGEIDGYITNSNIRDFIKSIPTFHTLIMADACFAGSMLAARASEPMENQKSRWVVTSGDMENVEDGTPGGNSPFAEAVAETLTENTKTTLRVDKLVQIVTMKMQNNAEQHPQGNALKDVGDQGGVFVFRKK